MSDMKIVLEGDDVKILDVIDQVVDEARELKSPKKAFYVASSLRTWGKIVGIALAKLLYGLYVSWDDFQMGDRFEDAAAAKLDISQQTIKKYVGIWGNVIEKCPSHTIDRFIKMPMESLILIAPAAGEDLFDEQDWERLSLAPDKATVRALVRKKRGQATSSKIAITIWMDRQGSVWIKQDDVIEQMGVLFRDSSSDLIQKGIDRIIRGAGMVEQW